MAYIVGMSNHSTGPSNPNATDEQGLSASTRDSYARAWTHFARWASLRGYDPYAPAAVINFLNARALRNSITTLAHYLSVVADAYARAGLPHPLDDKSVRGVWNTIESVRADRERDRAAGVLPEIVVAPDAFLTPRLRAMLDATPDDLLGHRDRLALIAGAAGSLTRTELVELGYDDFEDTDERSAGAVMRVHPSEAAKRNDRGWAVRSVRVAPTTDPAHDLGRAFERWVEASGIHSGVVLRPVSRHDKVSESGLSVRAVNIIVHRAAKRAGLESSGYMDEVRRASP